MKQTFDPKSSRVVTEPAPKIEENSLCPMLFSVPPVMNDCIGSSCAWYCTWAPGKNKCAIPLLAGMFADSSICRNTFETEEPKNA